VTEVSPAKESTMSGRNVCRSVDPSRPDPSLVRTPNRPPALISSPRPLVSRSGIRRPPGNGESMSRLLNVPFNQVEYPPPWLVEQTPLFCRSRTQWPNTCANPWGRVLDIAFFSDDVDACIAEAVKSG